jgi:hypothetical protein
MSIILENLAQRLILNPTDTAILEEIQKEAVRANLIKNYSSGKHLILSLDLMYFMDTCRYDSHLMNIKYIHLISDRMIDYVLLHNVRSSGFHTYITSQLQLWGPSEYDFFRDTLYSYISNIIVHKIKPFEAVIKKVTIEKYSKRESQRDIFSEIIDKIASHPNPLFDIYIQKHVRQLISMTVKELKESKKKGKI